MAVGNLEGAERHKLQLTPPKEIRRQSLCQIVEKQLSQEQSKQRERCCRVKPSFWGKKLVDRSWYLSCKPIVADII